MPDSITPDITMSNGNMIGGHDGIFLSQMQHAWAASVAGDAGMARVASQKITDGHKPLSRKQARKMLVNAIIEALKVRPQDFEVSGRYSDNTAMIVRDKKTGQLWDVHDGNMRGSERCGCKTTQLTLGFFQRMKVSLALSAWDRRNPTFHAQQEEALKLIAANNAA